MATAFQWLTNPKQAAEDEARAKALKQGKYLDVETGKLYNSAPPSKEAQANQEADTNIANYTKEYLTQLEEPYGKAYDKNRQNLISNVSQLGQERQAQQGMELGRMGLGNTVAGSLLKNKLATQQSRSLGQTLSGLDASRLQQMAGLKLTAMQMAANKQSGRAAENAALQAQKQEEAMAIPNMIMQYLGGQQQQAKSAIGNYLGAGSGLGSQAGGLYNSTGGMNTGYSYDKDGNLIYTGGV